MQELVRSFLVCFTAILLAIPSFATERMASVNINVASAEQIAEVLEGIGIVKAEAIVAYRKANGSFQTVESLTLVKGVGESTVERNVSRIVIEK